MRISKQSSCPARGMGVEISYIYRPLPRPRSCPARGMGVEIYNQRSYIPLGRPSCPARGMGVEMPSAICIYRAMASCPARGMGVEIQCGYRRPGRTATVMPREGHGSRNKYSSKKLIVGLCHAPRGAWE